MAEGDLDVTTKDLADAESTYKDVGMQCMTQAQAHDVSKQSRAEELKALAEAKKILQTMTKGAQNQAYSFLQTGSSAQAALASQGSQAVQVIKRLAENTHSGVLAQLAARMEAAIRTSDASSDDPFAKVKGVVFVCRASLPDVGFLWLDLVLMFVSYCDFQIVGSRVLTPKQTVRADSIDTMP